MDTPALRGETMPALLNDDWRFAQYVRDRALTPHFWRLFEVTDVAFPLIASTCTALAQGMERREIVARALSDTPEPPDTYEPLGLCPQRRSISA